MNTERRTALTAPIPTEVDVEIDARGLYCPLPIVHLGTAVRQAPRDRPFVIRIEATDPGFVDDLLKWLAPRPRVHLIALREHGDRTEAWIRNDPEPP